VITLLRRSYVLLPLVAVIALALLGLCGGSRWLSPAEFWLDVGGLHPVLELRLVRVTAALVIGGALALSGMVFQAVLRNPLAEPFTLGLSGGAAVGATLAYILGLRALSLYAVPFAALAGALVVLSLVLLVSRGGNWGVESLLLSGVIAGTICSSLLMFLLSFAQQSELAGVTWWMLGDLQGVDPDLLWPVAVYTIIALIVLRVLAGDLNVLSLGDEEAFYLGVNPRRLVIFMILIASLLAASTVCLAGIISFCGLIIPHIVRRLYGCDHRRILFTGFLWGGGFLILCDLLSRVVFREREIPIGVLTSLLGGVVFLMILKRRRPHDA